MCKIDWNALGTWAIAVLTGATLWKIRQYVRDTTIIAQETLNQSRASRRPYLQPQLQNNHQAATPVFFINVATAPALNLTVQRLNTATLETPFYNGAVAPDQRFYVMREVTIAVTFEDLEGRGVRLIYEDTARRRYWTTVKLVNGLFSTDTGDQ